MMRAKLAPMRLRSFVAFPLAGLVVLASSSACTEEDVGETDVGNLTDAELARTALAAMGAKFDGKEHTDGLCQNCHDTSNRTTFTKWATRYKETMATLKDESKSADVRVASMLRDPAKTESGFESGKIGILTAGAHLGLAPYVKKDKHPVTYAQNELLQKLFAGKPELFQQFKNETLMPVEYRFDRFSPGQYEAVVTWMTKGMPELDALIPDAGRPTTCVDDFAKLKEHPTRIRTKAWSTVNAEARLPMFACDAAATDASTCFKQTFGGKDVFPDATATAYGKTWSANGDTLRIAQDMGTQSTYYWSRTSADGRFFATGGSGGRSVIVDLAANLDPAGPKTRFISAKANYDPDFFPSNKAFMFQGTSKGGVVCAQSLLTNPATTQISFEEPQCSKLDQISLYQTVAQAQGDNEFSDIFVINNTFASDNPSLTSSAKDLTLSAGPESTARIAIGVSTGTEGGYKVGEVQTVPLPFQGDTMASRSLELLGSRVAGDGKMLGYAITRLTTTKTAAGYKFGATPVGRICMPGNKANFSFDERFLVTHHYLTREDFASDAEFAPYKDKGAADIYMADFVTGKKTRITRMNAGQFAIFPHFRSDGWIMFEVRDAVQNKVFVVAADAAIRAAKATPTP